MDGIRRSRTEPCTETRHRKASSATPEGPPPDRSSGARGTCSGSPSPLRRMPSRAPDARAVRATSPSTSATSSATAATAGTTTIRVETSVSLPDEMPRPSTPERRVAARRVPPTHSAWTIAVSPPARGPSTVPTARAVRTEDIANRGASMPAARHPTTSVPGAIRTRPATPPSLRPPMPRRIPPAIRVSATPVPPPSAPSTAIAARTRSAEMVDVSPTTSAPPTPTVGVTPSVSAASVAFPVERMAIADPASAVPMRIAVDPTPVRVGGRDAPRAPTVSPVRSAAPVSARSPRRSVATTATVVSPRTASTASATTNVRRTEIVHAVRRADRGSAGRSGRRRPSAERAPTVRRGVVSVDSATTTAGATPTAARNRCATTASASPTIDRDQSAATTPIARTRLVASTATARSRAAAMPSAAAERADGATACGEASTCPPPSVFNTNRQDTESAEKTGAKHLIASTISVPEHASPTYEREGTVALRGHCSTCPASVSLRPCPRPLL
jgi:hypothetical protein